MAGGWLGSPSMPVRRFPTGRKVRAGGTAVGAQDVADAQRSLQSLQEPGVSSQQERTIMGAFARRHREQGKSLKG